MVKCGTSGFLTGLGGLATMVATLPANITSVMYVQLRMCCAVAKMAGYDIHSDQVQTLIYACLTGSAAADILKQTGIKFGNKFGVAMVKKIPGETIKAINSKVGFRFVTKFGEKGVVNLGKVVPVLGGVILLVLCVMPTLVEQIQRRMSCSTLKRIITILAIAFSAFMVIGRLISGVHWFTDIVGGVLLSAGLFTVYKAVVMLTIKK